QLSVFSVRSLRSISSHLTCPFDPLRHTGTFHVWGAGGAPGVPMKRFSFSSISPVFCEHELRTETTGAPTWSTKLRMMRSTGLPVTRATSLQKSSPAALLNECFLRYEA